VPWCETCDRFLSPSTVHADGTCPACGGHVDPGKARALAVDPNGEPVARAVDPAAPEDDEDLPPVPWHLKLLAAAVAVYLGYRALQGIEWLVSLL